MELKHFSDDHSLKLYEVLEVENCTCDGCGEHIPVKSSRYRCYRYDFDLHPSCAELPRDLQHPIHRKHPLILHKTPPYDGRTCTCKACDLPCRQFVYNCSLCKFDLDIKCALLPLTIETEIHETPIDPLWEVDLV